MVIASFTHIELDAYLKSQSCNCIEDPELPKGTCLYGCGEQECVFSRRDVYFPISVARICGDLGIDLPESFENIYSQMQQAERRIPPPPGPILN